MLSHGAVASRYLGEDVVYEAFADWTKARVRPEVKVTLGMLAKLTRRPLEFGAADMVPLLGQGIPLAAIEQAVIIGGFIFNYQNRMADALGADIPQDKIKRAGAVLNLEGRRPLKDRLRDGEMIPLKGAIPEEIDALIRSITTGPGDLDLGLRQVIFNNGLADLGLDRSKAALPDLVDGFVAAIGHKAAKITDEDVGGLLKGGWSEAQVFEMTVTAAAAAAFGRLKIAWGALSDIVLSSS
ncbi:MAG: hypothetical protein QNJ45_27970 [Ardenticatenaceae bacterium]|nr:hypothetical protein [Ardenticatenaceae bacterium]